MGKNDWTAEEAETIRASRTLCKLMTADGTVDTFEEATVHIKDMDMFVTVQLLVDSPAVLIFGTIMRGEWRHI